MNFLLTAANANDTAPNPDPAEVAHAGARSPLLLDWLTRLTNSGFSTDLLSLPLPLLSPKAPSRVEPETHVEDWNAVSDLCGHSVEDFSDAEAALPLTAAEISYFRRNHRGTENHISRDFFTARTDLPSPLSELYGLYRHRARIDAEAALWLAQSTNSLRVAGTMADLLALGGFANGLEYVSYMGVTYSVPCAFDTSMEIDHANREAARRMSLPADHPSHLLRLTPDELGVLAASITERNALAPADFLEKANLLSEARQDVTRLPTKLHFSTVMAEHDLPAQALWTERLVRAYVRILPKWIVDLREAQAFLG